MREGGRWSCMVSNWGAGGGGEGVASGRAEGELEGERAVQILGELPEGEGLGWG